MAISALVTGGASGIGEAVARKLASRGIAVSIADTQKDRGIAIAEHIASAYNVKTAFHQVDVTQEIEVKQLVEVATSLTGRLDYAANCAGICETVWAEEESITTEIFDRCVDF
jgi:NAD(P)-dependent dehydrogenase (short-subunit alcohol dehydrogenase family)